MAYSVGETILLIFIVIIVVGYGILWLSSSKHSAAYQDAIAHSKAAQTGQAQVLSNGKKIFPQSKN